MSLWVYLLGPGVGESVVVRFPDGKLLVVDSCRREGVNLTRALLQQLGATTIDLFVLTHPDADHIRGAAELVTHYQPKTIWRYPQAASLRDFFVSWCRSLGRHEDLVQAIETLETHLRKTGRVFEGVYGFRAWPPTPNGSYVVNALAPTPFDVERARKSFERLLTFKRGIGRLTRAFERIAKGERAVGDSPNVLSMALSIQWGDHRLVLGGDVLCGVKHPSSGWKGIIALMDEEGRLSELRDLSVIKVPHHGSPGAFEVKAWQLHGKPLALIAPYSPSELPHAKVLNDLRAHASMLGVSTVDAGTRAKAQAAGWSEAPAGAAGLPCVSVELTHGRTSPSPQGNARVFR